MAGTSPFTMLQAIMIFLSSCLIGIIIAAVGGPVLDMLDYQFYQLGWFNLPSEWDTNAGYLMVVNIYYSLVYIIPVLGFFILFVTIYQRYRTDEDDEYVIMGGRL